MRVCYIHIFDYICVCTHPQDFFELLTSVGLPFSCSVKELVFARHQLSASISPAVLLARGSHKAASLLMGYAGWLRENPYLLDHQGCLGHLNHGGVDGCRNAW